MYICLINSSQSEKVEAVRSVHKTDNGSTGSTAQHLSLVQPCPPGTHPDNEELNVLHDERPP